jgi:hypothetical protein
MHDQSAEWNGDHRLHFDVGTIVLGQIWEVNFQLRAIKEGNINVFGSGSVITFNNGVSTLTLPDVFVSAYPPQNATMSPPPVLRIESPPGIINTNNATLVEFMDLGWWVTYAGEFTYNETVVCQYQNPQTGTWGPEVIIDSLGPKTNGSWVPGTSRIDVRTLPQGIYRITVRAVAADGAQDQRVIELPLTNSRPYIALK